MDDRDRARLDALLDLLADEVAARVEARRIPDRPEVEPIATEPVSPPQPRAEGVVGPEPEAQPMMELEPEAELEAEPEIGLEPTAELGESEGDQEPQIASHAAALMTRLAIGILVAVVLINIPFDSQGTALARSIPSSASLVIQNGLLVKESSSPDVWLYRDDSFHWITSLEAFTHYGYQWQNVHVVEDGFLNQFRKGRPIYALLKCSASPHVYQLDQGTKRWIVDIPTLEAEGYQWRDVQMVPCTTLRDLPDGETIPPGRGTPPPPLP